MRRAQQCLITATEIMSGGGGGDGGDDVMQQQPPDIWILHRHTGMPVPRMCQVWSRPNTHPCCSASEASKLVMSYVAAVCGKGQEVNKVKEQLLQSNPVLEGESQVHVYSLIVC